MSTIPYRRVRYLRPYLWPFPLWKYGPRSGWLTGEDLGEGWYVERFGAQEISREEALAASRPVDHDPLLCVEEGCARCCRESAANRPERAVK